MLTAWMLYTLLVTGAVAAGAWLLERALGEAGRATRWAWGGGMIAACLVPLLAFRAATSPAVAPDGVPAAEAAALSEPGVVPALLQSTLELPSAPAFARLDLPLALLWGALVVLLVIRTAVGARRLRLERRTWRRTSLPEGEVLVSGGLGPAVVGLLRNEVVVPEWCLELPAEDRELVLAHEDEHRRARDPLLVTSAGLLAALLPWNLPLGWMRRRLRTAVEVDCDRRVTSGRAPADRRRYGELLLRVGRRVRTGPVPLATFAEQPSALSRRIGELSRPPRSRGGLRALFLAAAAILVAAASCLVPGPDRGEGITDPEDAPALEAGQAEDGPYFTPYEVAPEIPNRAEVGEALRREYPPLLRDAGIGGTTVLHFFIDEEGELRDARVAVSSGHDALDEAALRVAGAFRFTPARNQGRPVPVWIQLPITFQTASGEDMAREREPLRRPPPEGAAASPAGEDGPSFTPYEVAPEILDREAVHEALRREYPALLRDAGIGGAVVLHVFIDEEGVVRDSRVAERSGHEALDQAALRVAGAFRFSPALNQGRSVPVWIQIPIVFRPD